LLLLDPESPLWGILINAIVPTLAHW